MSTSVNLYVFAGKPVKICETPEVASTEYGPSPRRELFVSQMFFAHVNFASKCHLLAFVELSSGGHEQWFKSRFPKLPALPEKPKGMPEPGELFEQFLHERGGIFAEKRMLFCLICGS